METVSGYLNSALTLQASSKGAVILGTIDGYATFAVLSSAGLGFQVTTFFSAVYGPDDANFTVENDGLIESFGGVGAGEDAGILLTTQSTVANDGTISSGGTGVVLLQGGWVANSDSIISRNAVSAVGGDIENSGVLIANGQFGYGVYLSAAPGTLKNYGEIESAWQGVILGSGGAVYNDGSIYAARFGVGAFHEAYVENAGLISTSSQSQIGLYATGRPETGTIAMAPTQYGIALGQGGTAANHGTISSSTGVYVEYGGGTVLNDALIEGDGDGVFLRTAGTVNNQGTILGGTGVCTPGGIVSNSGFIGGSGDGYGVMLLGAGTVTNTGTVSGVVGVCSDGGTIVNDGTIMGTKYAVQIRLVESNSARLVLDPAGVLIGAVSGGGALLELATGTVAGTIDIGAGGVSDFSGVTLNPGATWTFAGSGTIVSVTNYGTIVPAPGSSLTIETLSGSGVVSGGQYLGRLTLNSTQTLSNGFNSGTISDLVETQLDGVDVTNGGRVLNSGMILAGLGDKIPTFREKGLYYQAGAGIRLLDGGYAVNEGTISAASGDGFYGFFPIRPSFFYPPAHIFPSLRGGAGVVLNQGGLLNLGTITGEEGVYENAGSSIVNHGTISGLEGGVTGDGNIQNSGLITGGECGIILLGDGTITNTGTVAGPTSGNVVTDIEDAGINLQAGGEVVNSGTIFGEIIAYGGAIFESGYISSTTDAIVFNPGTNAFQESFDPWSEGRLILTPSATINGAIYGGGGTLDLQNGGSLAGSVTFSSSQVSDFAGITLEAGATWIFAGDATLVSVANYGTIDVAVGSTLTIESLAGNGVINSAAGIEFASSTAMAFMTPASLVTSTSALLAYSGTYGVRAHSVTHAAGTVAASGLIPYSHPSAAIVIPVVTLHG